MEELKTLTRQGKLAFPKAAILELEQRRSIMAGLDPKLKVFFEVGTPKDQIKAVKKALKGKKPKIKIDLEKLRLVWFLGKVRVGVFKVERVFFDEVGIIELASGKVDEPTLEKVYQRLEKAMAI